MATVKGSSNRIGGAGGFRTQRPCRLLSAFWFLPSAFRRLRSACCLLPSAFCLLLSAIRFLPSALRRRRPRRLTASCLLSSAFLCLFTARAGYAWGPAAHRVVNTWALQTLPPEIRGFFEANRQFLVEHANDPDVWMKKDRYERMRHYIYLDKYGPFPYLMLPHGYKQAQQKFGSRRIAGTGVLPWQIGEYSLRLTNALKAQKWEEAKLNAAVLGHYVADAHDPLNTTDNFDGQLTEQTGLATRFGASLIDRYANFFMFRPDEAVKIDDPTEYAFRSVLEANTWLNQLIWADRLCREGLVDYNDDYFDRFYTQIGSTAGREISGAAHDTGSYWYTAWLNAGRPALPSR